MAVQAFTYDIFNVKSIFDHTMSFNPGVVNPTSVVVASVSELTHNQDENPKVPMKGTAVLTLHNVVPTLNNVLFTIDTGWQTPINVRVFVMVIT